MIIEHTYEDDNGETNTLEIEYDLSGLKRILDDSGQEIAPENLPELELQIITQKCKEHASEEANPFNQDWYD